MAQPGRQAQRGGLLNIGHHRQIGRAGLAHGGLLHKQPAPALDQRKVTAQPVVDQPHPAVGQRLHRQIVGGHAGVHHLPHRLHQRRPLSAHGLPVDDDAPHLVGVEIARISGHQRQRGQPLADLGLGAGREAVHQQRQPGAQLAGLADLLIKRLQLPGHHHRQGGAVAGQHATDVLERQAQLAQRLDAVQPGHVIAVVQPVAGVVAGRRREQPDLVKVVQRPHREAAAPGQIANFQQVHHRHCWRCRWRISRRRWSSRDGAGRRGGARRRRALAAPLRAKVHRWLPAGASPGHP